MVKHVACCVVPVCQHKCALKGKTVQFRRGVAASGQTGHRWPPKMGVLFRDVQQPSTSLLTRVREGLIWGLVWGYLALVEGLIRPGDLECPLHGPKCPAGALVYVHKRKMSFSIHPARLGSVK